MLSRIRPLDVNLAFDDRPYKLGDSIHLTIELHARGDVAVRGGRVELVCEERWREHYTIRVPASSRVATQSGAASSVTVHRVPKRVSKEFKETYLYDSVVFLEDAQLQGGTIATYDARLEISSEPPPHMQRATTRWRLISVIDVARARDIKRQRVVHVIPA